MSRRKKEYVPPRDPGWTVAHEITHNGRHIRPGTELKIHSQPGRYRFIRHVTNRSGVTWIDVWGGPKGCEAFHSFYPSRIRTVHRIKRTDKALIEARRQARP